MTILHSFFIPSPLPLNYVQGMKRNDTIYLDHASGTFLLPQVKAFLTSWLAKQSANPSSIHAPGRLAASSLDLARQRIGSALGCKSSEVIFTSGATEANNLAIRGGVQPLAGQGHHIITCYTDHPSILESCKKLEREGYPVTYLPTDNTGSIDLKELEASITSDTVLISLMWVNNETGLVHPIEEIGRIAQKHNIRFHCDAVQAVGHFPIDLKILPVDSLSISGHKIGAPAGIGVLYLRKGNALTSQNYGGMQEHNFRAGTQNLMGALALAQALEYHTQKLTIHESYFQNLSHHLQQRLQTLPGIQINRGSADYSPHILNCSFENVDGEMLFIRLDMNNIAVSNGAACSSGSQAPSHVLTAMGIEASLAQASFRISLGVETTLKEIDFFADTLEQIIPDIQRESSNGI